jgi:uncharacterized membrane protein YedE/YeeE
VKAVVALLAGLLFAVGLAISGMTKPEKVIGFLDFTGRWDPSLAFVMMGAVGVHFVAQRLIKRLDKPVLDDRFHVPEKSPVDRKLVIGAALFGIGWGATGYCPGPVVVSVGAGSIGALVVGLGMLVGMLLHRFTLGAASKPDSRAVETEASSFE